MKKLLLLSALVGAMGLCSPGASAATIEANKAYMVKHVASGLYLNIETEGRGDGYGTLCASLESENSASIIYFVANPNDATQWQVHANSPSWRNLSSNAGWNSIVNSTDNYYWTITDDANTSDAVVLTRTGTETSTDNCFAPDALTEQSPIYTNKPYSGKAVWQLIPMHNVNCTVSDGDNTVEVLLKPVRDGESLSVSAYDGLLNITSSVPSGAITSEVNLSGTPANGVKLAKIVCAKSGYRNRWVTSGLEGLCHDAESAAEWFAYVPDGNNFKLFSLAKGKYIGAYDNYAGHVRYAADEQGAAVLKQWHFTDGSESISLSTANGTGSGNFFNLNASTDKVCAYSCDDGSKWFLVFDEDAYNTNKDLYVQNGGDYSTACSHAATLSAVYPATDAVVNNLVAALYNVRFGVKGNDVAAAISGVSDYYNNNLLDGVKFYVQLGDSRYEYTADIAFNGADAARCANNCITPWYNITVSDVEGDDKIISSTNKEFTVVGTWSMLNKVGRLLSKHGEAGQGRANVYWQYDAVTGKIFSKNSENADYATADRLFRLKGKIDGNELYVSIQGVAAGADKWFKVDGMSSNNNGQFADTETWYKVVQNGSYADGSFALQLTDNTNAHIQDFQASNNGVGTWTDADSKNDHASNIQFFALSESDIITPVAALDRYELGEGLHKYYSTNTNYDADKAAFASGLAALSNASSLVEFATALAPYDVLLESIKINQPERKRFYRFKGLSSGKYLGNVNTDVPTDGTADETIRLKMLADADNEGNPNKREDIYYLDEAGNLVSYTSGLCLGKFDGDANANKNDSWNCVNKETSSDNVGTVVFSKATLPGYYNITVGPSRYLYEAGENVDCGTSNGAGYRWEIEPVGYLPIYLGDAEEVAFYTPVNLQPRDGVEASMLYVNEEATDELVKKIHEGVLTAGKGYLLKKSGDVAWNGDTHCIYMQINNSGVSGRSAADNALTGSIYPTAKTERHFVMTGNTNAANDPLFEKAAEDVPAFAAHYVAPESNVHQEFKVKIEGQQTSGIEEIDADASGEQSKVYDLHGRRVSKAANGIFIVNGKKLLVK